MKVIHIINDLFAYGGTPKKLSYLVKYADKKKYKHVFICMNRAKVVEGFSGQSISILNAEGSMFKALTLVKSQVDKNDSIISVHFFKAFIVGCVASLLFKVPLVNNEHGSAYYRKGYKQYVMRLFRRIPRKTICNSNYVLNTIIDVFKFPIENLKVIYNPVEKRVLSNQQIRLNFLKEDKYIIGHVGGFIKQRNQVILVDAINELRAQNVNAYLVLIGDGPEFENIKQECIDKQVIEYVEFVGYTDSIANWLVEFDVFVNPTVDEGFGIAVVEAMLAEVPVVAAKAGAHPEIITDGVTGLLYEPYDMKSLTEQLMRLYSDTALCELLKINALNSAKSNYTPQKYSDAYHHALDRVCNDVNDKYA